MSIISNFIPVKFSNGAWSIEIKYNIQFVIDCRKAMPAEPPKSEGGIRCDLCSNECKMIAEEIYEKSAPPVLTATTLLVPFYVDDKEVENIASFIAGINPDIPYSLLVFHPDFYMRDMPITPREQVQRCYDAARRHLKNVNIGNKQLLL